MKYTLLILLSFFGICSVQQPTLGNAGDAIPTPQALQDSEHAPTTPWVGPAPGPWIGRKKWDDYLHQLQIPKPDSMLTPEELKARRAMEEHWKKGDDPSKLAYDVNGHPLHPKGGLKDGVPRPPSTNDFFGNGNK